MVTRIQRPRFILSGSAAAILSLSSTVFAVENYWTGDFSNDWNDPGNWSLGRIPSITNGAASGDPFDDAVVNSLNNFPVITEDLYVTPRDIVVGNAFATEGRIDHHAGYASTGNNGNWAFIGMRGGSGIYNLADTSASGGTLTGFGLGAGNLNINGRLYVGGGHIDGNAATYGALNVNTTGSLTIASDLTVGSASGTGVMNVDAGTITTGGWNFIGKDEGGPGANGTLRMSGGTITNNGARTFIGLGNATGTFEMSGGVYNNVAGGNDAFIAIGVNNLDSPTPSSLHMTGGTINSAHVFSVGGVEPLNGNADPFFVGPGKGVAVINGETAQINSSGELWVGEGNGSTGELTLDAGTIAVDNWLVIGRRASTGVVNVNGGTLLKTGGGHFVIGDRPGGNATLNQSGGTISILDAEGYAGELWIGDQGGTGTLNMDGGLFSVEDWVAIGVRGGTGTLNISGGTFNKTGPNVLIVGEPVDSNLPTTGFINQTGDSTINTTEFWVGQNTTGTGTYTIDSGTLNTVSWIAVGREGGLGTVNLGGTGVIRKAGGSNTHIVVGSISGTGVINQTGGQLIAEGDSEIRLGEIGSTGGGSGTWNISGGVGSASALRIGFVNRPGTVNIEGTGEVILYHSIGNDNTGVVTVSQSDGDGLLNVKGGSLTADRIHVGLALGKGIVNQTGGTITTTRWIAVGVNSVQDAEYNLSGGTTNTDNLQVGVDSSGIVRVSETGTLNVSGSIEVPSSNGQGLLEISGGTINASDFFQGGRDGSFIGHGVTNQSGGDVNITGSLYVQREFVGTGEYNLSGGTLSVDGAIEVGSGKFTFTGGTITRSTPGDILFNGSLTTGGPEATIRLNNDKSFYISGELDNSAGLTLNITGLGIPDLAVAPSQPVTGTFFLGMVGAPTAAGAFNTGTTYDSGFDATFLAGSITLAAFRINEGDSFNPMSESVYWIADDGSGSVSLNYSVIPEPGAVTFLSLAGAMLALRRRRKS